MTAVVLDGVVLGLQLAVLGVGLTLVFGLAGVLNLAHGQLAVLAAVVAARLLAGGVPPVVALAAGVAVAGLGALLLDATLLRVAYHQEHEARAQSSLLLTLAVALVVDGMLAWGWPFVVLSLRAPVPAIEVAGVVMRGGSLAAAGLAAAVLAVLLAALRTTRTGRAIRAVAQDAEAARSCGIDVADTRRIVVVLSGLLAGVVAITQALASSVGPASGMDLTVLALIVAVVGGLGSVSGALVAGLALGLVHAWATWSLGAVHTSVLLLVAAILAIVARPTGIVGERAR